MACAGSALAQAPAGAPKPAAPTAQPAAAPSAVPAAQPAAAPATAPAAGPTAPPSAAPTAPAAPAPGAAEPTPPPPPPQYATPQSEPPPPHYQPLGGTPEPEIEKGDWDPWEHVGATKHRHDGFLLRLAIGVAFGGMNGDDFLLDPGSETGAGGAGFSTTIGIGGALTENLVLNADLFQTTFLNPTIEVDGHELGDADKHGEDRGVGENVELTGLGIGVTYYFMPVNIYLAGAVGIGQVVFVSDSGERAGSDAGLSLHALVGKEWWVGVDWGIGVAGELVFVRAQDDYLGDVTGLGFGVLFTATYN
jgi:hypothetical protein